ncbi:hypothetical protein Ancab_009154 [Ancistrocladus abbreviatus]
MGKLMWGAVLLIGLIFGRWVDGLDYANVTEVSFLETYGESDAAQPLMMETQDCNSSDIRLEAEVGSANASNNFSPDLIEDFNDIPSNQDDFDQSTIDPSARPSKKIRSKVLDHLIKIRAENLKDQKAQCKYCNAILVLIQLRVHLV